jgi:opacity protein-like surface antigen
MYPFNNKFSIFGFVGLAQTWLKAHYKPLVLANTDLSLSEQATATKTFKSHGSNLVLKIGAKYNLTDSFGIKGVVAWENTNKFKTKSSQSPATSDFVKHKNTTKVGIGFYLHI